MKIAFISFHIPQYCIPQYCIRHVNEMTDEVRGDYRFLSDVRKYPRYLAIITYHLLLAGEGSIGPQQSQAERLERTVGCLFQVAR